MDAVILSCGTELATGQCADTNSSWLAARLTPWGVRVLRHVTVDDDLARLSKAIHEALLDAELVIVTGGLGPTADDLTREAVAAALGVPLEENREALAQLLAFFERWQRPMPDSNRKQAHIPRGCSVIANPRGTAPGIRYITGPRQLYVFPGVPAEMKAMFEAEVAPALSGSLSAARTEMARLLCFGISEARLGEELGDLMERGRNPSVGTTASHAVLSVRVLASGGDPAEARRLLDADVSEVRRRLGDAVFGQDDDTLHGVVGQLLQRRGATIATAESCTGGLIAKCLTDVPGSSAYFLRGVVAYSNAAKSELLNVPASTIAAYGAVSEEVAKAMADACRRMAGSDFALSVTGIAGPSGGSPPDKPVGLVYIGVADRNGVAVTRYRLGDHLSREEIRDRAAKWALNILRLRLLACTA